MVLGSVLISFFYISCPVFPAPLIEEAAFSPLYIPASFIKDTVTICAWVYRWAFYPVPLIYISVFVPVPYTVLITVALYYSLKLGSMIPLALFFFFKIVLAIQFFVCISIQILKLFLLVL